MVTAVQRNGRAHRLVTFLHPVVFNFNIKLINNHRTKLKVKCKYKSLNLIFHRMKPVVIAKFLHGVLALPTGFITP